MERSGLALLVVALCVPALAQRPAAATATKNEPAPRWPDGHVNLGSAPGAKGYFEVRPGLGGFPKVADIPFQPWAKAVYEARNERFGIDSPLVDCKPSPGPAFLNAPGFEIVEVPE